MIEILLVLLCHTALTAVPLCAGGVVAVRRGLPTPVVLSVALLCCAVYGLLGFWAYYADPTLGKCYSLIALGAALVTTCFAARDHEVRRTAIRVLVGPLTLWFLASGFLLMLGFAHGGAAEPILTAQTRFSHPLPADNSIPYFFADWFYAHGHHGSAPLFADWLASDRPPLQLGFVLAERPFEWTDAELHYQILSVLLQQLWVVGLWALLTAARVSTTTRALAMVAVLLSDLVFVNGFYVWPKLLPAALLLAAASVVLTPLWGSARRDWRFGVLLGGLVAMAMLGHGSTMFGLAGIALVGLLAGRPGWRLIAGGVAAGVLLMAPWSLYQALDEPPANRLSKWMLAGQIDIDQRTTREAIVDNYRDAGVRGTIDNKVENFTTITGVKDVPHVLDPTVPARDWIRLRRLTAFYDLLPSLGLLIIGPAALAVAMIRRRGDPKERRFAGACLLAGAVSAATWGLLLFGNDMSRTTVHVGSYAVPILLLTGSVVGLRVLAPRFAVWWTVIAATTTLLCYLPALDPLPGTHYSPSRFLAAALALVGFAAVLWWTGREDAQEPVSEALESTGPAA